MIRAALIATALAVSAPAYAAQPVTLAGDVSAAGDTVTLGDLFGIDGEVSMAAVARAPAPGETIYLEAGWLQAFAAGHDLDWANAGGLQRIAVKRESRQITADEISAMIADELSLAGGADTYEITFAQRDIAFYAPNGARGDTRILRFDYNGQTNAFAAEIEPYAGAPVQRVSGRAFASLEVPALSRAVSSGQIITESDIIWTATRADRLRQDAVLDASGLIGMQAKRSLRPGEPLREYDIKRPAAVEKGSLVTVFYQKPGLTLTARGRALEEGAKGEVVRIVNLSSNRTIEAVAAGPGKAVVRDNTYLTASLEQGDF